MMVKHLPAVLQRQPVVRAERFGGPHTQAGEVEILDSGHDLHLVLEQQVGDVESEQQDMQVIVARTILKPVALEVVQ